MRTRYWRNNDPKPTSMYIRTPIEMVPLTEEVLDAWVESFNERYQPEKLFAGFEFQAMKTIRAEGVDIVSHCPPGWNGAIAAIPDGKGVVIGEIPERAQQAIQILWSVFLAKLALSKGSVGEAIFHAVGVGALSEFVHVLRFEPLIEMPSKYRQKGAEATKAKSLVRTQELARRVHALHASGKGVQEACSLVALQWKKDHPESAKTKPESLREMARVAYRKVYPKKKQKG